jgi:hypothetical protein
VVESGQTSDFFLSLPTSSKKRNTEFHSVKPVRSRARWRIPSHGGYAWAWRHRGRHYEITTTMQMDIVPAKAGSRRSGIVEFSPGRLTPMRHRHHRDSPLKGPAVGTEVPSRGGQSSSVRRMRRGARRPESRPFPRSRPRQMVGGAFPLYAIPRPAFLSVADLGQSWRTGTRPCASGR